MNHISEDETKDVHEISCKWCIAPTLTGRCTCGQNTQKSLEIQEYLEEHDV